MIGQTVSHYKILEKLGSGGMGVVYKAQDLKLDRFVALKFLPPHLSESEEEKKRFMHEAKAASSLDHPNICTVHEIDQTRDDQIFIAMAYYEGETLKQKIERGPLPTAQALEIAIQITQSLAQAHEHVVVHRDLKPANVIITTEGMAKILDFGLAKLAGASRITKTDSTLGTAAYMSPEQARGEEVDHRTDIWSLGVVLYEMVTGHPPFTGEKEPAVLYAILVENPKPATELRPEIPVKLAEIIRHALEKDADERYQRMSEMLGALADLKKGIASGHVEKVRPSWQRFTRKRLATLAGFAGVVIALLAIGSYFFFAQPRSIDAIAVLPFINVSADPTVEYLSDGMSESLIRNLAQLPRLKVMSFSAVSRYKGREISAQEIGRELEVQAVLVGRVTQRGEALSVSAELVDARDHHHIWGREYHRKLADLLQVQTDLADQIAKNLHLRLTGAERKLLARNYTEDTEAYQLYLKGRYHTAQFTKEGFAKGSEYFRQALAKDPHYALAYNGLAFYYISVFEWLLSPREALSQAKEAALKALALDETFADAHASLGVVYFCYDWDWPAAEREFKRAMQLNPNYATTYNYYSWYLIATREFDEALAAAKRAQELDPFNQEFNTMLGWILTLTGQKDLAITQLQNTIEMNPNFWFAHIMLAGAYESQDRFGEAVAAYERAIALESEFAEAQANLACCYVRQGRVSEARQILASLKRRAEKEYIPPYFIFMIHFALGEKDEALPWLEAAYEQRCIYLIWDKVLGYSSYLKSDPRVAALLDRVGVVGGK